MVANITRWSLGTCSLSLAEPFKMMSTRWGTGRGRTCLPWILYVNTFYSTKNVIPSYLEGTLDFHPMISYLTSFKSYILLLIYDTSLSTYDAFFPPSGKWFCIWPRSMTQSLHILQECQSTLIGWYHTRWDRNRMMCHFYRVKLFFLKSASQINWCMHH